jgi:quercetin dioxygenase-like cupin family protein
VTFATSSVWSTDSQPDAGAIRSAVNAFMAASALAIVLATLLVPGRSGSSFTDALLEWCGANVHAMSDPAATGRPRSIVTTVSVEDMGNGKEVTTQLVVYPPGAFTPKHVHGGVVSAYVLKGTVRSQVSGQPVGDFKPGQTFFEPTGSIHVFAENPSTTETAELLATIIHDKGATLTTFID